MNNPALAPGMFVHQVQIPQGHMLQAVAPVTVTDRQARMHKRFNRLKDENIIKILASRNHKFRAVLKKSKAHRIAWMERAFGTGNYGVRHLQFLRGRNMQMIRRAVRQINIGRVQYIDFLKARPSNSGSDDRWFECGLLTGNMPLIFEAFAHYLEVCVYTGPFVRTPTDIDIRANFYYFFTALRTALKLRESDVSVPQWMYKPGDANVPNGVVVFNGETWNGMTVEHAVAHPPALPPRRVARRNLIVAA